MISELRRRAVGEAKTVAWHLSYLEGPRAMSRLRLRWQRFRNPKADIRYGVNVVAGPGFRIHAPWGGTLVIGDDVEFRRNALFELEGPHTRVTVGNGCRFTYDVIVQCGRSITIGERVILGQNTLIADGNHRYRDLTRLFLDQGYNHRAITIADDAVVHSKVTIINNIGERAIIAANAVVAKPIPAFTVAGGVPAKVIEYYGPPGQEPPS